MKALYKSVPILLLLLAPLLAYPALGTTAQLTPSTTPSYDPFVEPPLPPNPTDYELGRNLYWHWCMTCHGDRGQGLTDEFRGSWEPDHQNCWAHGCHAGKEGDMGFPIPTVVPAVANEDHLKQFASLQKLTDFLKGTHPPQSPGVLKDEEYHAIAVYAFAMNGRLPVSIQVTESPVPVQVPPEESAGKLLSVSVIIVFVAVGSAVFALIKWARVHHKKTRKVSHPS